MHLKMESFALFAKDIAPNRKQMSALNLLINNLTNKPALNKSKM